ncbi:glycosyltransferase family 2 protein [Azospirillum brasilense]|uniref:glycosyltransferase family 2 protein n=1 Tax=Azospirillum brasilense TaxID=192 RepID=UPI001FFF266D|nr:glycosyltransferase [Azospirillum brasilense]
MLGIGVVTHRRPAALATLLDALRRATHGDHRIVVADDGSGDETLDVCRQADVPFVTGANRGVAWNKNRALHWLLGRGCDRFILLEDDTGVTEDGWNRSWIEAIDRWHHVNWMGASHIPFVTEGMFYGGHGTPEEPYVCEYLHGLCMAFSLRSLAEVGFYDTRFRGYGFEHLDLTIRNRRAGFGVREIERPEGAISSFVMIPGGLTILDMPSGADLTAVERNRAVFHTLQDAPIHRLPWQDDAERHLLESETGTTLVLPGLVPPGHGTEAVRRPG